MPPAPKKKKKGSTVTIKPKKKGQKPIKFKNDGSLRKAAGTNKSGKVDTKKVRKLAKGKGDAAKKARFYLNVLKK